MGRRKLIVLNENGPACPRCGRPMQVREHDRIREKQLRQPFYYSRWFRCMHGNCKTKIVHREEFKIWNTAGGHPRTAATT